MGLGILQSKTIGQVPATVILDETAAHSALSPSVKHIEDTNSRIVLVPQPTDDPNDPLNWSKFEKHSILCIICLGTIVVTVVPVRTERRLRTSMKKTALTTTLFVTVRDRCLMQGLWKYPLILEGHSLTSQNCPDIFFSPRGQLVHSRRL